ncbi:hypothetical protein HanPSC8_Chr08g0345791 [Helianthus annuus]|nr:hypothetical protein HanPSC8_Chr08g0345791 [Helianthus annuus]
MLKRIICIIWKARKKKVPTLGNRKVHKIEARKKKVPTLGNRKVHKIEVNPQCRRLGKLERAYAHFMTIKRFL